MSATHAETVAQLCTTAQISGSDHNELLLELMLRITFIAPAAGAGSAVSSPTQGLGLLRVGTTFTGLVYSPADILRLIMAD